MTIAIRAARAGDEEALAVLTTQLGYPSTAGDIVRRLPLLLDDADHRLLVAADADDRAVGWIHAIVQHTLENDPYVQIVGLVVRDDARGGGIGSQLVAEAERWARELGVAEVRVRSNVVRERTHAFYLTRGYATTKTSLLFVKRL